MISSYAKIVKIIDDITRDNYEHYYIDIRDHVIDLKANIAVYYDKNNIDKNPIFKLINDVDWDCWHQFNDNFRQEAVDEHISLVRVQFKKDIQGQNINNFIKNINRELYEIYSTLRTSHNIIDQKALNEIFSYLEELAPRIKKNRPELFESYKNIMSLTGPCKAMLPKLVQNEKTTGHRILRKDEEQKIDESFSNLFSNISSFITELEKPKLDIIDKIEYELKTTPIICEEAKSNYERLMNSLNDLKKRKDFLIAYNTNPQFRKNVDETYNMAKATKDITLKKCKDLFEFNEKQKENKSTK
jgi:hypothetical protein